jgi:hypothetical protein
MKIYLEYAEKVNKRKGLFLPKEEVVIKTGFRTTYGFNEADALEVRKTNNSRGLGKYKVYSDELFIDLDTGDNELNNVKKTLGDIGLGYRLYSSGNKGFHFSVETVPVYGNTVGYTQKRLIEKLNIPCDLSIYRNSSLFRLPGTIHQVSGNKKELIEDVDGGLLSYTLLDLPSTEEKFNIQSVEFDDELKFSLTDVIYSFGYSPGKGNRYMSLWKLAKSLGESGLSERAAAELLLFVNASWGDDKHPDDEVLRAVQNAYC